MTETLARRIYELGNQITQALGETISERVMEGYEPIAKTKDREKRALWMKDAIERLSAVADPETCHMIMSACGHDCIAHHAGLANGIKNRRKRYRTERDFLEAEIAKRPVKAIRLELHGDVLTQYYCSRGPGASSRCYCGLVGALPEGTTMPIGYCQCSRGFVEKYWEGALGRPVTVEVIETALSGAFECKFLIHL